MINEIRSGPISRRTFSLVSAAFGVTLPATILAVSEAVAQTPGMERREERRDNRLERREERRDDRLERRENRRDDREDRRDARRSGSGATTGSTAPANPK
jgi:hypothetical protein